MLISVIVPTFESGRLLLEALDSIRHQQGISMGSDVEVVIADDGSHGPASAESLAEASRLPGVRVVSTKGRTGPSAARNLAAKHACGMWLSFLDADDIYSPDALRLRWSAVQAHPDVGCVMTDYAEFAADLPFDPHALPGLVASTPRRRTAVQAAFDSGTTVVLDRPLNSFIGTMPMCTISVFLRREVFESLGGFPEGHHIGEDLHLWLRIAATQRVAYVPKVTAYCRKGHASLTQRESRLNLKTAQCYAHLADDPLMRPVRHRIAALAAESYVGAAYDARMSGATGLAWRAAAAAVRWRPWSPAGWRALLLAPLRPRSAPGS